MLLTDLTLLFPWGFSACAAFDSLIELSDRLFVFQASDALLTSEEALVE
jgi:hypothetical protein